MEIKKFDRYLLSGALIVLGVFAVFGFFTRGPEEGRRTALALTWLAGEEFEENRLEQDEVMSLIGEFEERNPGIRIRLTDGSHAEGDGSGEENFPAGVIVFDEGRINGFIRRGFLAPLNPYLDSLRGVHTAAPDGGTKGMDPESNTLREQHTPSAWGGVVDSGTEEDQRVIPLVSFMDILFYNIDLLKAEGFDRPPKTREEFLACARAMAARREGAASAQGRGGAYGTALALSPGDRLGIRREIFPWAWAAGAAIIRDGQVDFSGRPAVETLRFLGQLHTEGLLSPGSFDKTRAQKNGEFARGTIAMMTGSTEDIPLLRKRMGDAAFGITQIPGPAGFAGKPAAGSSSWYAGISASCEYPDEAWTFLTVLAEKSPLLAARVRAVPGSGPQDYITGDDFYAKAWDIYEASDLIREFSGFPEGDELEALIREELPPLFEGSRSAADTAAAIQNRWDRR
jgi:ABC-type glycerol-3-phosphate transport system substrate-binding protein